MSEKDKEIKKELKKHTKKGKLAFLKYCEKINMRGNLNAVVKLKIKELQ